MKIRIAFIYITILLSLTQAWSAQIPFMSKEEFSQLAVDIAPKVNLFKAIWSKDPNAQFFGGTTRDFLYWIKGNLQNSKSSAQTQERVAFLRSLRFIDVRDFITGDSDVDVVTNKELGVSAQDFGVKNIDKITSDRFDPKSEKGKSEIDQGFLPLEKIRLSQKGFVANSVFGDGVGEVYDGKPTLVMPSRAVFDTTYFARQKINHPILLVLRYLRSLAIDYFQSHGRGVPDPKILFDIDPESERIVRRIVGELKLNDDIGAFHNERFLTWMRMLVRKSFRAYVNPTATMELYKKFGVADIVTKHSDEPINQYVFAKARDKEVLFANLQALGVDPNYLFTSVEAILPGRKMYHGTKTDQAFRAILRQGVISSSAGLAGDGLYGVGAGNIDFAKTWGGDANRLIEFDISQSAKVVDLRHGIGAEAFSRFVSARPGLTEAKAWSEFADYVGADILVYKYKVPAVVVKNSAVLEKTRGVYRNVMTYAQVLEEVSKVNSVEGAVQFWLSLLDSRFTTFETKEISDAIIKNVPIEGIDQFSKQMTASLNRTVKERYWLALSALFWALKGVEMSANSFAQEQATSLVRIAFEDMLLAIVENATDDRGGASEIRVKSGFLKVQRFLLNTLTEKQLRTLSGAVENSIDGGKQLNGNKIEEQKFTDFRKLQSEKMAILLSTSYFLIAGGLSAFETTRPAGLVLAAVVLRAIYKDVKDRAVIFSRAKEVRKIELGELAKITIDRKLKGVPNFFCTRFMKMKF